MGVTYSQFQLQTCIPGYYGGRPTCRNSQCRIQGPRLTQVFYLSNYLSIYLFIYLYIYLYIYLFIYLSVFLSIYLSIYLSSIEKGYPHWHQELRLDDNPAEAGLLFTCKLKTNQQFLGRDKLQVSSIYILCLSFCLFVYRCSELQN